MPLTISFRNPAQPPSAARPQTRDR